MWDGTTKEIEDPFESVVFVENRHMCYFELSIHVCKVLWWYLSYHAYNIWFVANCDGWEALILFMRALNIK